LAGKLKGEVPRSKDGSWDMAVWSMVLSLSTIFYLLSAASHAGRWDMEGWGMVLSLSTIFYLLSAASHASS
jgi:hypothetical protein